MISFNYQSSIYKFSIMVFLALGLQIYKVPPTHAMEKPEVSSDKNNQQGNLPVKCWEDIGQNYIPNTSNEDEISLKLAVEDYHDIRKTERKNLSKRREKLEEIASSANQLSTRNADSNNLKDQATNKASYLKSIDKMYNEMDFTEATRDMRKILFWYIKNYVGISSHGIGLNEGGIPLCHNISMKSEFLQEYSDPEHRDLVGAVANFKKVGSDQDFFLWLESQTLDYQVLEVGTKEKKMPTARGGFLIDASQQDSEGTPLTYNGIYTLDSKGLLNIGPSRHHPVFTWGGPVICGGEIVVKDGKILNINNNSGHYLPTTEHLYFAVRQFSEKNLFDNDAKIIFNLGEEHVHTLLALVNLKAHNINVSPNINGLIEWNLPSFDSTHVNPIVLDLAKRGASFEVERSIGVKVGDFLALYTPPTGESSWRYSVMNPETHEKRGDSLLQHIISMTKKDDHLKRMVFEEMARMKGVKNVAKTWKSRALGTVKE